MDGTLKIFTNEDSTATVNYENNESLRHVLAALSVIVKYCKTMYYS